MSNDADRNGPAPSAEDSGATRRRAVCQPPVDIQETPEGLILKADLPGVTKDALELVVEDNILKIFGRSTAESPANFQPVHHEFRIGDFYRSFILGDEVDADAIKAELEDGVLTLRLPKRQTRPRRIELDVTG